MSKFNVPKRTYAKGPKKPATWRLPEALLKALDKDAEKRGWTTTDIVTTALDQYLQWANK